MEISLIDKNSAFLKDVCPDHVLSIIRDNDVLIVGGEDNEIVQCFAVVAQSPLKADECILVYVYVVPACRGKGMTKLLIDEVCKMLKADGKKCLTAKTFGTIAGTDEQVNFLLKNHFMIASLRGIFMTYDVDILKKSIFASTVASAASLYKNVIQITDRNDPRLIAFCKKAQTEEFFFDRYNYDTRLTFFYEKEGKLLATVCAKEIEYNQIYVDTCYYDKDTPANILPILLGRSLNEIQESYPPDTVVTVSLWEDSLAIGVFAVVKGVKECICVNEMFRKL